MKTTIYYFSATGNTLSVAKKLQGMMEDVELVSIADALANVKVIEAQKIGFLFPIYAWGMPRIVSEFIDQLRFGHIHYCFSISTGEFISAIVRGWQVRRGTTEPLIVRTA